MEELALIVGILGNIIAFLLFLSPVKTFWRIVENRSTEEFESYPYIFTLLSSSLWTYYGVTKPGGFLVATINGFGVVVQFIYIVLFLFFAPPLQRRNTAVIFGTLNIGFVAVFVSVTHFLLHGDDAKIQVIGLVSSTFNVIMYAAPLSAMRTVVRMRSVEYIPFLLILFIFLNGGVWTLYAILVQDLFIGVPNAMGCVLGIIQLVLYGIYRFDSRTYRPLLEVDPEQ